VSGKILTASRLRAGYVRGLPIVHDISVEVGQGEVVTLVGPNGAGKSTFLKALAGLVLIEAGEIRLKGRDVTRLPTHEMVDAGIGFVPQTGNIFASLSIEDNLIAGGHILPRHLMRERVERAFAQFPALAARRAAPANVLSGGQRQMLAVARALMTEPGVIMLDEPTAGLAPKVVQEVLDDLRRLAGRGVAVLMVEQNAKAALRMSDRGYILVEGRNHKSGTASELMGDGAIAEAFLGSRSAESKRKS
jgi:branched-chain amino acid transport system ATP-binding protein